MIDGIKQTIGSLIFFSALSIPFFIPVIAFIWLGKRYKKAQNTETLTGIPATGAKALIVTTIFLIVALMIAGFWLLISGFWSNIVF